jgi:hypothetical protein
MSRFARDCVGLSLGLGLGFLITANALALEGGTPGRRPAMAKANAARPVAADKDGPLLELMTVAGRRSSFSPLSPECQERMDAVRSGYLDAIGGRRFLIAATLATSPGHPANSLRRPQNKACKSFTAEAPDNIDLRCCNEGYMLGLPELLNYIRGLETPAPGTPEAHCKAQFEAGQRFAEQVCEARGDSCPIPAIWERRQRNLFYGCYHLGFMNVHSVCDANGQMARILRDRAPSLIGRSVSGRAGPTITDLSQPGAGNAGSALGGEER